MTDQNVERAKKLDCATLSDAMDKLAIEGVCRGIKPRDHKFRFAGRAYTVLYGPVDASEPGTVGDYVDDMKPSEIAVLDNGGREDCTVWGDILTQFAHTRGLGGTVIDGPCRDVHLFAQLLDENGQGSRGSFRDAGSGFDRRCQGMSWRYSGW